MHAAQHLARSNPRASSFPWTSPILAVSVVWLALTCLILRPTNSLPWLASVPLLIAVLLVIAWGAQRLLDASPGRHVIRSRRRVWLAGTLVVGFLLVTHLEWLPRASVWQPNQELSITATGEKNARARGSEVWVRRLLYPHARPVAPRDFDQSGTWQIRHGELVSFVDQPAKLHWCGKASGPLRLILVAHPWSGMVEVSWNGNRQRIDLYSPEGTEKSVELAVPPMPHVAVKLHYAASLFSAAFLGGAALALAGAGLSLLPPIKWVTRHVGWRWLRPALAIAAFCVGLDLTPATGRFSWEAYLDDALPEWRQSNSAARAVSAQPPTSDDVAEETRPDSPAGNAATARPAPQRHASSVETPAC